MPAVQVRECPQDLYDDFKEFAKREDRSLSQQVLHVMRLYSAAQKRAQGGANQSPEVEFIVKKKQIFEDEEAARQRRIEKRKAIFERAAEISRKYDLANCPVPDGYESIAEMIRADREERTNRIIEAAGRLG